MKTNLLTVILVILSVAMFCENSLAGPYQATGIKIGEVTDSVAIVWTRLTKNPQRIGNEAPLPEIVYPGDKDKDAAKKKGLKPIAIYPDGSTIDTIEGAAPGALGEVRVMYKPANSSKWEVTGWHRVDEERDHTHQFKLGGLEANLSYLVKVESRDLKGNAGQTVHGQFKTAPSPDESTKVVFTVSTGQRYTDKDMDEIGFKIYPEMLKLDPSFFVHTGDILYYDSMAKSLELARWHWERVYSLPTNVDFHRKVTSYFIRDDHDTWKNDCWPTMESKSMGDFTFKQGIMVFNEQVPMGEKTWRTYRWGKDLQIWMVEGRDFRSANTMEDGPDKTIWGDEQKAWFKRTVKESDATFRILISPTPVVGPDRTNKADNHSNEAFAYEGNEIRKFMSSQNNMFSICGDRHWQYVSVDSKYGVREYSCGPASDEHAGGWKNEYRYPEHKYLNVIGGFLSVTVDRAEGKPTIIFRHHGVDGKILNEDIIGTK
jgi:alkaline phosphatase D